MTTQAAKPSPESQESFFQRLRAGAMGQTPELHRSEGGRSPWPQLPESSRTSTPGLMDAPPRGAAMAAEHAPWGYVPEGRTAEPPAVLCEAAGLEVAVRSWWRGAPGRGERIRRQEDAWLRIACAGGVANGARQRLLESGIPNRVIEGGIQLGQFLEHDDEVRLMWSHSQQDPGAQSEFVQRSMEIVLGRYDIRVVPWRPQVEGVGCPCLVLAARAPRPGLPRRKSSGIGGRGSPTPRSQTPVSPVIGAGEQRKRSSSSMGFCSTMASPADKPQEAAAVSSRPRASSSQAASPLPVEGPSGRASVVTPSPPGQPGSLGRGSVSPSLPSTAPGQAGGRRSTARGSAWEGASPTEAAAVGVSPRLSRRLEQRASLAAVEPSGGEPRPPERGSVAGASPRRSYIKKASQSSSFDKWISNVKRSVKQQHELEIVQEHEKQNAVEETPMLAKSSKKAARKVIRDLSEIRRVFTHFDKDGSGLIEPCEFLPLLSKLLRQPVSEMDKTEVWKNWDQVDTDGSGQISWEEFQTWYCETFSIDISPDFTDFFSDDIVPTTERLIREVAKKTGSDNMCIESIYKQFTALDNDKSGHLDKAEFQILIERQITQGSDVQELPAKVLDKLWLDIDADGSGMVSFEEFAVWYLKFFLGDISPMEQYYKLLGSGFRSSMVQEMETPTE